MHSNFRQPYILKTAGVREKGVKLCSPGKSTRIFCMWNVQCHSEVIRYISGFRYPSISKFYILEWIGPKFRHRGVSIDCIQGKFASEVSKAILESFGAFLTLYPEGILRAMKRSTIVVISLNSVLLTVNYLWLVWRHSVHFRYSTICILKTAGRRVKQTNIWASWGDESGL